MAVCEIFLSCFSSSTGHLSSSLAQARISLFVYLVVSCRKFCGSINALWAMKKWKAIVGCADVALLVIEVLTTLAGGR